MHTVTTTAAATGEGARAAVRAEATRAAARDAPGLAPRARARDGCAAPTAGATRGASAVAMAVQTCLLVLVHVFKGTCCLHNADYMNMHMKNKMSRSSLSSGVRWCADVAGTIRGAVRVS
jgi:hypothetical protein